MPWKNEELDNRSNEGNMQSDLQLLLINCNVTLKWIGHQTVFIDYDLYMTKDIILGYLPL